MKTLLRWLLTLILGCFLITFLTITHTRWANFTVITQVKARKSENAIWCEQFLQPLLTGSASLQDCSVTIPYPKFEFVQPRILGQDKQKQFLEHAVNKNLAGMAPVEEKLLGVVAVQYDGIASANIDCGWSSNYTNFEASNYYLNNSKLNIVHFNGIICPLIVPDGASFQHFIDGVLPKIIQVHNLISNPKVKLLIYGPREKIIFDMLEKLGIQRQNVLIYPKRSTVRADILLNTCHTPPVHPVLWQNARTSFGAPSDLAVSLKDAYVILLTRAGSYNKGRTMLNKLLVLKNLTDRYGRERVHLFKGNYNLDQSMRLFGRAGIVIGVHGGAFYNMIFCPSQTAMVEMVPTASDGLPIPPYIAHTIVWKQAVALNQPYWRIPHTPHNPDGDINVDLEYLNTVLDDVDRFQK